MTRRRLTDAALSALIPLAMVLFILRRPPAED